MAAGTLIIRTDASVALGTGHVMRCLALAQAWQDAGGDTVFTMAQYTPATEERLRSERFRVIALDVPPASVQDAAQVGQLARTEDSAWVVVDGYHFGAEYQRNVKRHGTRLLFIDDIGHAEHYFADLVLNQNLHAGEDLYRQREPYTKLLLGPRYAVLRREFQSWREWRRETAPVGRKVLVTMGGSDTDNVTARAILALQLIPIEKLEATVVVGGSNPHIESLEQVASHSARSIRLLKNVQNMPELMAWADVAVAAAGSTCWELSLLGLPTILVDVAANQTPIAHALDQKGVAVHLGSPKNAVPELIAETLQSLLLSEDVRATMSQRARELVDGRGAARVISAIRSGTLRLRRVEEKDCRLLWEWANDPEVRAVSFSSEVISWEQHLEWFRSKCADPKAALYLATDLENAPVGHVRYQLEGTKAVVSINLATEFRGKGHGNILLAMATEELFRSTKAITIDAYVKPGNEASLRLFTRAGFRRGTPERIRGQQAVHFVLEKKGVL
jgi:UDP-2,4-diacetamido-2,4,6-trideoxy-beta-L-altropyranose hydrolase